MAIDGSKFKAVNNRDTNFTTNKIKRRREQIEASIERYLSALATADRQAPDSMRIWRQIGEHLFGTFKFWMAPTHFLTRTLKNISTGMSLHVPAYNRKRVMNSLDTPASL